MKRLSYIVPETEVVTAYAQELMDAVNDGNVSGGVHVHLEGSGSDDYIDYDLTTDKSKGGDDAIVDAKNMWGNLWED